MISENSLPRFTSYLLLILITDTKMTDLKPARIFAIETSCDETAAILEDGRNDTMPTIKVKL